MYDGSIGIWMRLKFLTLTTILKATQVCATAAFVSSAKSACVHPDRKDPYLCLFLSINVMRLFAASEPSDFHTLKVVIALATQKWLWPLSKMRRQELLLDALPWNFVTTVLQVCAAAAFVSSAKSQCIHPERKDPYLCRVPNLDVKKEHVFNWSLWYAIICNLFSCKRARSRRFVLRDFGIVGLKGSAMWPFAEGVIAHGMAEGGAGWSRMEDGPVLPNVPTMSRPYWMLHIRWIQDCSTNWKPAVGSC